MKTVLVTGCCGYIGSNTTVALLKHGFRVIGIDNFSNSSYDMPQAIKDAAGEESVNFLFIRYDLKDKHLEDALAFNFVGDVDSIIHFAALKSINESVENPVAYYENNVSATINLLKVAKNLDIRRFVFSSTAAVYGNPVTLPIDVSHQTVPTSPYGQTKLAVENMLKSVSETGFLDVAVLRYFNPVGAMYFGDNPDSVPANLFPYVLRVATGEYPGVNVYGTDYKTSDGTGVRDYIHIEDIVDGHIRALEYLVKGHPYEVFNLGTGIGYSVLEVIREFEKVTKTAIPAIIKPRRPGDVAICYANPAIANQLLGWNAKKNLNQMVQSSWDFILNKPRVR